MRVLYVSLCAHSCIANMHIYKEIENDMIFLRLWSSKMYWRKQLPEYNPWHFHSSVLWLLSKWSSAKMHGRRSTPCIKNLLDADDCIGVVLLVSQFFCFFSDLKGEKKEHYPKGSLARARRRTWKKIKIKKIEQNAKTIT
jgi:hypothetical protein